VIRVLLIGDVRVSREGLASLLSRDGRLEVADHVPREGPGRRSRAVDVIVVETSASDAATLPYAIEDPDVPIVVLGAPDEEREVIALAELGVLGFVEREASLDELVACVVSAARGEACFPARIATTLLRRVSSGGTRARATDVSSLTVRERQVVQLIAEALSNKEIAARLGIEVATVKNHVHNILEKLDVNRRFDAVARLRVVESADEMPTPLELARARSRTRPTAG
jgi:two-component system, NarL family, nitrate/nitrite response regulator NarL